MWSRNEQGPEPCGVGVQGVVHSDTGDLVVEIVVPESLAGSPNGLDGDDVTDLDEPDVCPEVPGQMLPLRVPLQGIKLEPHVWVVAVDVDATVGIAWDLQRALRRVDNDLVEESVGGVSHTQITGIRAGLVTVGFVVCGDGRGTVQTSLSLTTMPEMSLNDACGGLSVRDGRLC